MDELLGRKVPYSAQAEQAVVGSILIDPSCVPAVMEKLRADEFYGKLNRDIYETVYHMFAYGITVDPVTVLNQMRTRGVYQDNCEQYLAEVMRMTPTAANVLEYAAIVRDRALLRRLGEAADEINSMVYEGSGEADAALEAAERKIYALRQGRNVGGLVPVSSVVQTVFDQMSEAADSGKKFPGISTGLSDLDRMILGLNKSELILIAARPGMGKTSIALNMALYAGLNLGKTVAIFSLEMSREQLVSTGQLTDRQWRDVTDAAQSLSTTDIRIDDNPTLTVSDMNAQCRRVQNLDLVVIDYLQLMQSAGSGHSWSNESRQRHQPHAEDHGEGTQRAGGLPVPAVARQRIAPGQAPDAFRPARIRRHRTGCRRGHRPVSGRVLQQAERKPEPCRGHHPEKPQGRDRDRPAQLAAGIHVVLVGGTAIR